MIWDAGGDYLRARWVEATVEVGCAAVRRDDPDVCSAFRAPEPGPVVAVLGATEHDSRGLACARAG